MIDNSKELNTRKRVRTILSRWGVKIRKDVFACPRIAQEHLYKELKDLFIQGFKVKVTEVKLNGKGRVFGKRVYKFDS